MSQQSGRQERVGPNMHSQNEALTERPTPGRAAADEWGQTAAQGASPRFAAAGTGRVWPTTYCGEGGVPGRGWLSVRRGPGRVVCVGTWPLARASDGQPRRPQRQAAQGRCRRPRNQFLRHARRTRSRGSNRMTAHCEIRDKSRDGIARCTRCSAIRTTAASGDRASSLLCVVALHRGLCAALTQRRHGARRRYASIVGARRLCRCGISKHSHRTHTSDTTTTAAGVLASPPSCVPGLVRTLTQGIPVPKVASFGCLANRSQACDCVCWTYGAIFATTKAQQRKQRSRGGTRKTPGITQLRHPPRREAAGSRPQHRANRPTRRLRSAHTGGALATPLATGYDSCAKARRWPPDGSTKTGWAGCKGRSRSVRPYRPKIMR